MDGVTEMVTIPRERFEGLRVDQAIVSIIMPQLCVALDDLLDHAPDAPKELVMRVKKLLPAWAPHSMEQSPPHGKSKRAEVGA